MSALKVEIVETTGREAVVALSGEAVREDIPMLARILIDLAGVDPDELIVDASAVTEMDESAVDVLADVATIVRANGGHLVVRQPSAAARHRIDLTAAGRVDVVG